MVARHVNFPDPELIFKFLKGRCHGNRFWAQICEMTFIQHTGISKLIRLSQFRLKIFSGNIFSTCCAYLIKIGPVTQEKLQIMPRFDDRRSFATIQA